jgi:hypothetical protein
MSPEFRIQLVGPAQQFLQLLVTTPQQDALRVAAILVSVIRPETDEEFRFSGPARAAPE